MTWVYENLKKVVNWKACLTVILLITLRTIGNIKELFPGFEEQYRDCTKVRMIQNIDCEDENRVVIN